jgi:hypothetical protein
MDMRFQGLPGDQDMVRRTFQRRFEDVFGKNANAKELYLADPCFLRFARICPRPAYLLGHLQTFYTDLRTTLATFVAEYCKSKIFAHKMAPPTYEDPFPFFHVDYDYSCFFLHLRATLRAFDRSTEPLAYELAQDVLDILDNRHHLAIVDELLSADLATELDETVGHTSELGFWQVRKAIARTETIFSTNARYIRDRLEHRDEVAKEPCSHCRPRNVGIGTGRSSSPLGREWSFTPSSSTFNGPDTESDERVPSTKKRRV